MKYAGCILGPAALALILTSACGSDEKFYPVPGIHGAKPSKGCGNGVREHGEACDDGNTLDDDGCSSRCSVLDICNLPPNPGSSPCKRGRRKYYVYDRTDNTCKQFTYSGCGGNENRFLNQNQCERTCLTKCGNGIVERGEQCDDGNEGSGDGCSAECAKEASVMIDGGVTQNLCPYIQSYAVSPLQAAVGSSIGLTAVAFDPEGDPSEIRWAASAGDIVLTGSPGQAEYQCSVEGRHTLTLSVSDASGCNDTKQIQITCAPEVPVCGDTFVDPREACEDGNRVDGDGCSASCELEATP
jgi:cysteine-rich repeat protein